MRLIDADELIAHVGEAQAAINRQADKNVIEFTSTFTQAFIEMINASAEKHLREDGI